MIYKTCTHPEHKGRRNIPLTYFSKHPKTKDGRQSICKECNRRAARERVRRLQKEKKKIKPRQDYKEPLEELDYHELKEDLDYKEPWNSRTLLKDLSIDENGS